MPVAARVGDESGSHDVPEPRLACGIPNGAPLAMAAMSCCASSRPLAQTRAAAIATRLIPALERGLAAFVSGTCRQRLLLDDLAADFAAPKGGGVNVRVRQSREQQLLQ